jgi:prepilin-type processing-associated H-X9-DG protein
MEQQVAYNALNWNFGARWSTGVVGYTDANPPDVSAAGGANSIVQYTVLVMQINSFLCPSDTGRGASGQFNLGGNNVFVGSMSYATNVGLNRRINGVTYGGNPNGGNWVENGPTYTISQWDTAVGSRQVSINTFTDGTSNTAIFSEWVRGPAQAPGTAKNTLGMVYQGPASNAFPDDYQFAQACMGVPAISVNQAWSWKGEWWAYGGTSIYSHTNLPNRFACQYSDQAEDRRATITLVNASSNHPGGVNVLFMDGSVRFVKNSVSYLAWYAISTPDNGETVSADQL